VKVFIVDNQNEARKSLMRLCERSDDLEVIGWTTSGRTAMKAADALKPDLMFMDVELPDISGFELLRTVGAGICPLGIMMSTCADHSTQAFEEGALDYIVMPVTPERFDHAMARARQRFLAAFSSGEPLRSNSTDLICAAPAPPRFLVGERQRKLYPLDPKSIDYIEADGNYVTLRVDNLEYLSRDTIKHLSAQLANLGFVRITRSLLVNATAVSYAEVAGHGTFALTLTSGVCLHSTAAYRESLLRTIPLPALSKRYASAES
jgi:two-component system LytT family response regulator